MNALANGEQKKEPTRLAVLDVGTNSIRLVVAEVRPDGTYRLLDDEKETTRLGQGVSTTGRLSDRAIEASVSTAIRMKAIADGYGAERFRAVGTSAVREAENRQEFRQRLQQEAGIDLELISAEEEGHLAHLSVSHAFDLHSVTAAVVDIGGGSVEIALSTHGVLQQIFSLPLGAVRLTEQFDMNNNSSESNPVSQASYRKARQYAKRMLDKHVGKISVRPQLVFGTGGTFTSLAAMAIRRARNEIHGEATAVMVRGFDLDRAMVKHLLHSMKRLSIKDRSDLPGLNPDRSDIIIAGALVVDAVLTHLEANSIRVHDRGIRDGLLLRMIRQMNIGSNEGPKQVVGQRSMEPVRQFATACNYERAHSEHVTVLAVQVFDQLAAASHEDWMTPDARSLLEAASILHDVGYFISYAKHHKHSYHLIMHSDIAGWTHQDLEIVANIARYHRRAAPKKSHMNFASLSKSSRLLVRRLAAIMRVVDGLDRAHAQHIRRVELCITDNSACFRLFAEVEPVVDMWGAQRKSDLFAEMFKLPVEFEWHKLDQNKAPSVQTAETCVLR